MFSLDDLIQRGANFLNGKIFEVGQALKQGKANDDFSIASHMNGSSDQNKYFQIKLAEVSDPVPQDYLQTMRWYSNFSERPPIPHQKYFVL